MALMVGGSPYRVLAERPAEGLPPASVVSAVRERVEVATVENEVDDLAPVIVVTRTDRVRIVHSWPVPMWAIYGVIIVGAVLAFVLGFHPSPAR